MRPSQLSKLVLVSVCFLFVSQLSANENLPDERVRIAEIEGEALVEVLRGKNSLKLKRGAVLRPGDRVLTREGQTVQIFLAQGMTLTVAEKSEFKLTLSGNAERSTELTRGTYRGKVDKVPTSIRQLKGKRHRLMIQTKTAVMGVRGTDFVAITSENSSQFHTLEGVVDVAKTETQLVNGQQVTELTAGNQVQSNIKTIEAPKSFNVQNFASNLGELSGPVGIGPTMFEEKETEPVPSPHPSAAAEPDAMASPSPDGEEKKSEEERKNEAQNKDKSKEKDEGQKESRLKLWNFEAGLHLLHTQIKLGPLKLIDNQRGLGVAWTPRLKLVGEVISFVPGVGFIFFEDSLSGFTQRLFTFEGRALLEFKLLGLMIQGGVAARKWTPDRTRLGLTASIGIKLGIFFLDRLYLGAGVPFGPPIYGREFLEGHAGVGLSF